MKKPLIILAAILLPASTFAQTTPNRSRTSRATSTGKTTQVRATQVKTTNQIAENITLQLKGDFQRFVLLDIELTGTGPLFSTDLVVPAEEKGTPPTIISFETIVTSKAPDSYQVEYNLSARIAVTSSISTTPPGSRPTIRNIEYRDVSLSGSVKLTTGKPVTLSKLNGKSLSLGILKPAE